MFKGTAILWQPTCGGSTKKSEINQSLLTSAAAFASAGHQPDFQFLHQPSGAHGQILQNQRCQRPLAALVLKWLRNGHDLSVMLATFPAQTDWLSPPASWITHCFYKPMSWRKPPCWLRTQWHPICRPQRTSSRQPSAEPPGSGPHFFPKSACLTSLASGISFY